MNTTAPLERDGNMGRRALLVFVVGAYLGAATGCGVARQTPATGDQAAEATADGGTDDSRTADDSSAAPASDGGASLCLRVTVRAADGLVCSGDSARDCRGALCIVLFDLTDASRRCVVADLAATPMVELRPPRPPSWPFGPLWLGATLHERGTPADLPAPGDPWLARPRALPMPGSACVAIEIALRERYPDGR